MITTQDIKKIYDWSKETTFPLKKAPVIKGGYCNKIVYISWLKGVGKQVTICLLYTSPSPRDRTRSRMPSSA